MIAAGVVPQQRELDYHAAAAAGNWQRAEQLALAGLQDRDHLTKAERDIWAERLAVVNRKMSEVVYGAGRAP